MHNKLEIVKEQSVHNENYILYRMSNSECQIDHYVSGKLCCIPWHNLGIKQTNCIRKSTNIPKELLVLAELIK